ncbi:hypothetical protein B0H13DRAFT_2362432 [Mycena leptocephala]|nr:hypothetical protein B0H13DRAFT_2362432 [Mycena leptocephala]
MLSDPPSASQFSSPNMSDKSAAPAISDPSPQQELESLISLVAALSQMSLAMTKHCLDVQTKLPRVVNAAAAAGIAAPITPAVASPTWVQLVALTPDQLDAAHPTGNLDDIAYHVVTIGRDPGLYTGTTESDYQVLGVPDGKRRRIVGVQRHLRTTETCTPSRRSLGGVPHPLPYPLPPRPLPLPVLLVSTSGSQVRVSVTLE